MRELIKNNKGEVFALCAALSYAATTITAKWASANVSALFAGSIKIIPILIFSALMFFKNKVIVVQENNEKRISKSKIIALSCLIGLVAYIFGNTMYLQAFKLGGVVIASPIVGTQSIWAALIGLIILKEKFNLKMLFSMLVLVGGIFLLAFFSSRTDGLPETWLLAIPAAFVPAIGFAISANIQRYLLNKCGVNRWFVIFISFLTALIMYNIILIVIDSNYYSINYITDIIKLLISGLINVLAIVCITSAMIYTNVANAVTINSMQTAIAPMLAALLLGETMSVTMLVSILIITIGAIMVQKFNKE